jgi:hypothetical protein
MKRQLLCWFTIFATVIIWFVLASTPAYADNCGGYTDCASTADATTLIGVAVGVAVTGGLIAIPTLLHTATDPTPLSAGPTPLTITGIVTIGEIGTPGIVVEPMPATIGNDPSSQTTGTTATSTPGTEVSETEPIDLGSKIDPATAPFMEVLQQASVQFLEIPNQPSPPHSIPGLGTTIDILIDRMNRMPNSGSYPTWIESHWRGAEFALRWILAHHEKVVAVELDKFNNLSRRTSGPDAFLSDGSLVEFKSYQEKTIWNNIGKIIKQIQSTQRTYPARPIQIVFDSRAADHLDAAGWQTVQSRIMQALTNAGISGVTITYWP